MRPEVAGAAGGARSSRAGAIVALLALLVLAPPVLTSAQDEDVPWNIDSDASRAQRDGEGNRVFSFLDNVVITDRDVRITCDEARYLEGSRRAVLTGNVIITQDSTVVRGPFVYYDRERRIARFPYGVLIERPTGTAVADIGTWYRDEERIEMRGRVAMADTSGTMDANAATYDMKEGAYYAVGDARLVDDVSGVVVEGQNLRYDEKLQLAFATGDPTATFTEKEGDPPIHVAADRMNYDPNLDVAVGIGNVKIRRETMEASADSASFFRKTNRAVLRGAPELVDGATVVRGERMDLTLHPDGRRTVRISGAAQVSNRFLEERVRPEAVGGEGEGGDEGGGPAPPEETAGGPDLPELLDDVDPEAIEELAEDVGRGNVEVLEQARERVEEAAERVRQADASDLPDVPEEVGDLLGDPTEGDVLGAKERVLDALETADRELAEATGEDGEEGDGEEVEEDERPPWLKIPGDQLPTENLLFGDEIVMEFVDDELRSVEVLGNARSKFFPNEEAADYTEWNDVSGDTLYVWFSESTVDSVTVLGNGVGEYRFAAGEFAGKPAEILKKEGKLVAYRAPSIRYRRTDETMFLDEGAEVDYQTMTLKSGSIEFDAQKEVMIASGDPSPTLVDGDSQIMGRRMNYHMESERGEILDGVTEFENGHYRGKDIWKMGENELAVRDAVYTTCEYDKPHYHFDCKKMKLYLNDKMVAKPIILRIRNIPVLIFPYYMTSLKKGRQSGFLLPNLELGVDDTRGRFIRNMGYYWAPNDYMDATATFDFYPQQDRLVSRLTGRYRLRYRFDGEATVKYNRDVQAGTKETAVELRHQQTLSETSRFTGSAFFVTSSSIYQDIDDARRLDRDLQSFATWNKTLPGNRNLNVDFRRNENLDTGQINEQLPSVSFTQPSLPITGSSKSGNAQDASWLDKIYYRFGAAAHHQHDRGPDPDAIENRRIGSTADLNLQTNQDVVPFLRISPSVTSNLTWVEEDATGQKNQFRGIYATSIAARTDIYGTFLGEIGPARGFRHVIRPNVSWNWAPDFDQYFSTDSTGTRSDRFPGFGPIRSTPGRTNSMRFGIQNLIQTKVDLWGKERRLDLFNISNSINYNFLADSRPLSNLTSAMTVLSAALINQTYSVSHDPYTWRLLNSSVKTALRLDSGMFGAGGAHPDANVEDPLYDELADADSDPVSAGRESGPSRERIQSGQWGATLSHTFTRSADGSRTSNLVLGSRWNPTSRWGLTFDAQYDLQTGVNTAQKWSVKRIIHCWELAFDRRLLGGEWQYYFRINVIDIPDLEAERGNPFGR